IVASPSCFLLCYGMRRYLPSFPTRRSSDLRLAVVVLVVPGAAVLRPIQKPHVVRHNLRHPPPATVLRGVAPVLHPPFDGHQAAQDRKSTRLNSIHVKISYAVFCL